MGFAGSDEIDAQLKDVYGDGVEDITYPESAWFAQIPKDTSGSGRRFVQPVQYGVNNGRSRTHSIAQANRSANKYEDFVLSWKDDYGAVTVTRKAMKQTKDRKGSFFEELSREIDGMLRNLAASCAISLYRGTGGARARINSSYSSGTTITLADIDEIVNFEVGDSIVFSTANGDTSTDTLTSSTAVVITARDADLGTLTVSATTGLAANSYIFIEGDFQASLPGILAWIPASAPGGSDSFNGVNRSVDVNRLAGSRMSPTTVSYREAIRLGLARIGREGGDPDTVMMNHAKYRDLELELDDKVQYTDTDVTANVGFRGIKFTGSGNSKPVTVYADHRCPNDYIFILKKSSWKLRSMGPVPEIVDEDGSQMFRDVGISGFRVDAEYYATCVCDDPRSNLTMTVN